MAIRNKNISFILCQNCESMNDSTIVSDLEIVQIKLFTLSQYHSGFV